MSNPEASSSTSPYRQPPLASGSDVANCQCVRPHGKNLVLCMDGTTNMYSRHSTNVVHLKTLLINIESKQKTYYIEGIGTEGGGTKRRLDSMFALTFKEKVIRGYQWLAENYKTRDRVFLFGFSRGAYKARVISGMIAKVGLLDSSDLSKDELFKLATEAYGVYKTEGYADINGRCAAFKSLRSHPDARTHFVGVWDTVSAIGFTKGPSHPATVDGMNHVCVFRHALALDELRVKFLPEYVNGGQGPGENASPHIKEVWFAGSHSDIGGSKDNGKDLGAFGPSLRWMRFEAISNGVLINTNRSTWTSDRPTRSMTGRWIVMEPLPISHLSYRDPTGLTRWPHWFRPRQIQEHQRIHDSVFENYISNQDDRYLPKARPPEGKSWNDKGTFGDLVEVDRYGDVDDLISILEAPTPGKRLRPEDLDRLISLRNHPDLGPMTLLAHPKIAILLLQHIAIEIAEWKRRLDRPLAYDDRFDRIWEDVLSILVDTLVIFAGLPEGVLDIDEAPLTKLFSDLEVVNPEHKSDFDKLKKLQSSY